jgi:dTDP-glucose pyrophosphorylase
MKASGIKNVLIVSKTTRMERLLKRGIQFTPKIAQYNKEDW